MRAKSKKAPAPSPRPRRLVHIDPRTIEPPHEVRERWLVRDLAATMREAGWLGRPLLIEPLHEGRFAFRAWTGTHRLAASLVAKLPRVPALVLRVPTCFFELSATNEEAWELLDKLDDKAALALFRDELVSDYGQRAFEDLATTQRQTRLVRLRSRSKT